MFQSIRVAAPSIRLILAMFRLYAGIEEGFGKAILDILKKQFPGQQITETASAIGHKMMAVARRELQNNNDDAMDAVQEFLRYITTGSKYETDGNGRVKHDEEGNPIPRKDKESWDFAKDSKTWREALDKMYRNIKTTAMSGSYKKTDRNKKERSIDQAYGKRGEEGGDPEGGEGRMPTPDDSALGKALDDKAAVKEFVNLIDSYIPDLKAALSPACRALFDLIFEDEIGGFSSDIKDNMGQASALKDKLVAGSDADKQLYEKNAKRWSGFVGDTRKQLLEEIWDFIDENMSPRDFQVLRDTFFADTTPEAVDKQEKKVEQGKTDLQRGKDLRKVLRMRENKDLDDKEKKSLQNLEAKLKKELGGDEQLESALSKEKGSGKQDNDEELAQVAALISSRPTHVMWA